jgi:hypothetical protein
MQIPPRRKSPRAPSLALEQALERVMRVYEQERLHTAPVDAVAQALGFKSASSGSVNTTIASLLYFGLLMRPKDGFLSVSRDVEIYKFARDGKMKMEMLLDFLKTPPLYRELLEKYPSGLPSSTKLKAELLLRGFLPQAVDTVLSAFLQSVSYARYYEAPSKDIESKTPLALLPKADIQVLEEVEPKILQIKQEVTHLSNLNSAQEMDQIPIRLSGGRKAWLNIPTPFYESDKALIKAQIGVLFADAAPEQ